MAQTTELPKRADVPRESTWNAEALFKDWGTWQRELENTRSALPKLCTYSGKLNENAETLADWLDGYDQFLFARLERAFLLNTFIQDIECAKVCMNKSCAVQFFHI